MPCTPALKNAIYDSKFTSRCTCIAESCIHLGMRGGFDLHVKTLFISFTLQTQKPVGRLKSIDVTSTFKLHIMYICILLQVNIEV